MLLWSVVWVGVLIIVWYFLFVSLKELLVIWLVVWLIVVLKYKFLDKYLFVEGKFSMSDWDLFFVRGMLSVIICVLKFVVFKVILFLFVSV